ncbi:hypothetical protein MMC22_001780 [Lobaria immixta]|nr:hypothetical protein [Lobaria immixta]
MAATQLSSGLGDSPDTLASMTPAPLSETNDIVPLEPSINAADLSSDSSESATRQPPRGPSKARAKKARKARQQALSTSQPRHPPLRPAKDILSRIRHDPALDDADFIVGYHDRHADVIELPVMAWRGGGDVTDEEFIPQHRILYFRRKGDGIKIWDRKERLDLLFHSGNGNAKENEKKENGKTVKEDPADKEIDPELGGKDHDGPSDDEEGSINDGEEMVSGGIESKVKDDAT